MKIFGFVKHLPLFDQDVSHDSKWAELGVLANLANLKML